jgi:hypothetical protein
MYKGESMLRHEKQQDKEEEACVKKRFGR